MSQIRLTQDKVAIIDDEDLERVSIHKWHFNKKGKFSNGYAQRSQHIRLGKHKYRCQIVYLHRFILNLTDSSEDVVVDHINGDGLDNRKVNLRATSQIVNMRNRSKQPGTTSSFIGIHLHKQSGKFRAQIKFNGKIKSLGMFDSESEAVNARNDFIKTMGLEGFRR